MFHACVERFDVMLYEKFWELNGAPMCKSCQKKIQNSDACYDIGEEEESELSNCIERGPLGIYREYMRYTPNPRLGAMTIIPLTPPLKCNVNTMALHLKSGTKYMS